MAEPHGYSSFDYKVTNGVIKNVLDTRGRLDNVVQIGMPFVKATTTIQHPEYLGSGRVGFTLGLHAIAEETKFEDIFSSNTSDGSDPLVGYTYANGKNHRVYANTSPQNETVAALLRLFDQGTNTITTQGAAKIPPPGITRMQIGRNKNGLLASGQLDISVPTLTQLEYLHRVFLIPGAGIVLEWGQQFAPYGTDVMGQSGITSTTIQENMFPWYDDAKLKTMLTRLANRQVGLEEILNCYVYPTQGQYMWMFGRIATFSVRSNADGSFAVTVKIVGPSEDSFAYSTRATVLPGKAERDSEICVDQTNSVETYFSHTAAGLNLKTLLDDVNSGKELPSWTDHVVFLREGNKKSGEPPPNDKNAKASEKAFMDHEDAYFMSWRFFVNVVINHPQWGVRAIFEKALTQNMLTKISLLQPYADGQNRETVLQEIPGEKHINDPRESYVGYSPFLRSVDPGVMLIINDDAIKLAKQSLEKNRLDANASELFPDIPTELERKFKNSTMGLFTRPPNSDGTIDIDRAFLSSGVWVNHKAVCQAMLGADTVLRGISNLLDQMSRASANYWQLTIDSAEPVSYQCPSATSETTFQNETQTWSVLDINYRPNAQKAVDQAFQKLHVFNKLTRDVNGVQVGSEVIDCSVDMSLPKLMFAQIATMGLVKPADLQAAGVETAEAGSAALKPLCESAIVSDGNDALRQMFAITSLSATFENGQGPDLTYLPHQSLINTTCGKSNMQSTAEAGGVGAGVGGQSAVTYDTKSDAELEALVSRSIDDQNSELCKKCAQCGPPPTVQQSTTTSSSPTAWSAAFISYVMKTAGVSNFPVASSHTTYAQAIRNGVAGWSALDPKTTVIQVGDLVVNNRDGNTLTFTTNPWTGPSHGDIVVSINGTGGATLIGGNLSSTVRAIEYRTVLTADGTLRRVAQTGATTDAYFVVLRPPASFVNSIVSVAKNEQQKWASQSWNQTTVAAGDTLNTYYATANMSDRVPTIAAQASGPPLPDRCDDLFYQNLPGTGFGSAPTRTENGKKLCKQCAGAVTIIKQANVVKERRAVVTEAVQIGMREFPGMQTVFRYYEMFSTLMLANIRCDADGNKSNPLGASPASLSLTADITLPGINGLRVGELFWVDRIPAFYKAFGAFQVMSIEDTIQLDGWQTKIHSRFAFLGKAWQQKVLDILTSSEGSAVTGQPDAQLREYLNFTTGTARSSTDTIGLRQQNVLGDASGFGGFGG
jgi:hypothetical protein